MMKVGDLVRYDHYPIDDMDQHAVAFGLVVEISRTGRKTYSAKVRFMNGDVNWYDTQALRIVNESR